MLCGSQRAWITRYLTFRRLKLNRKNFTCNSSLVYKKTWAERLLFMLDLCQIWWRNHTPVSVLHWVVDLTDSLSMFTTEKGAFHMATQLFDRLMSRWFCVGVEGTLWIQAAIFLTTQIPHSHSSSSTYSSKFLQKFQLPGIKLWCLKLPLPSASEYVILKFTSPKCAFWLLLYSSNTLWNYASLF